MVAVRMSLQPIDPNGWYRLTLRCLPDVCLDVINNGSAHADGLLQMAFCGNFSGQFWQFVPAKNGTYNLRTMYTGPRMLLDIRSSDAADPHLTEDDGTEGRFWKLVPMLDGTFKLVSPLTGWALGAKPDLNWHGRERLVMSVGDGERQRWTMTRTDNVEMPAFIVDVKMAGKVVGWAEQWVPFLLVNRYLNVYTLEWSDTKPTESADPSALPSDLTFHAWSQEGPFDTFKEFLDWDSRQLIIIDVTSGFNNPKILERSEDFRPVPDSNGPETTEPDWPLIYTSPSHLIAYSKVLPDGTGSVFVIAASTPIFRLGSHSTASPDPTLPRLWKGHLPSDTATFHLNPLDLRQRGVEDAVPADFTWCSKGIDADFRDREAVPVRHLSILGHGGSAVVDRVVGLDRILARKQIRCNRRMPRAAAMRELEAIRKVQSHQHVINIIGSYTQGMTLGILLHPAAECDLQTALERVNDSEAVYFTDRARYSWWKGRWFEFFGCLAHALAFMHGKGIRHRDIKPRNILVTVDGPLYTDFGIARDFSESPHSTTTGPTERTHIYCAPEVAAGGERGRSSDVFSLGCVFLELYTVLTGSGTLASCTQLRRGDEDGSYHANADKVEMWISQLVEKEMVGLAAEGARRRVKVLLVVRAMLGVERYARPSAEEVWKAMRDLAVGAGGREGERMCGSCCFDSPVS